MNKQALTAHVLQLLARAQSEGRFLTLEALTAEIRVRRADVRGAVSVLHREGMLDALRMRLTLPGFAIGRALLAETLPPLRTVAPAISAAA